MEILFNLKGKSTVLNVYSTLFISYIFYSFFVITIYPRILLLSGRCGRNQITDFNVTLFSLIVFIHVHLSPGNQWECLPFSRSTFSFDWCFMSSSRIFSFYDSGQYWGGRKPSRAQGDPHNPETTAGCHTFPGIYIVSYLFNFLFLFFKRGKWQA